MQGRQRRFSQNNSEPFHGCTRNWQGDAKDQKRDQTCTASERKVESRFCWRCFDTTTNAPAVAACLRSCPSWWRK